MWESAAIWGLMAVAVYGAISATASIIALFRSLHQRGGLVTYLVLVKDQAERVEGVVRTLAAEQAGTLLLADLGSADESAAILERLALDFDQARMLGPINPGRQTTIAAALAVAETPLVVIVDLSKDMGEKGKT